MHAEDCACVAVTYDVCDVPLVGIGDVRLQRQTIDDRAQVVPCDLLVRIEICGPIKTHTHTQCIYIQRGP